MNIINPPKYTRDSHPIWTVFFTMTDYPFCYHIEIGHKKGPNLSRDLILSLAKEYWKQNKKELARSTVHVLCGSYYNRLMDTLQVVDLNSIK